MGHDTGAPFAVVVRLSWGVCGGRFAALVRGIVAIAWYGIQTYVASLALKVAAVRITPGLQALTDASFLGLTHRIAGQPCSRSAIVGLRRQVPWPTDSGPTSPPGPCRW